MIRNVLSIAGSDPSGGAGIQADIKAISANGAFAMAAVTALTAQNTQGVSGVHLVPPAFVGQQITSIFDDIRVDAIKIGMIGNAEIADAVATALGPHLDIPAVLDPVMIAKGGATLLADSAITIMRDTLLPLAHVLTPNLPEAAHLLGVAAATSRQEMIEQATTLLALGPRAILLKGGHLDGDISPDLLITKSDQHWFDAPRIPTKNTHGTGCTLSAALAAQIAKGMSLPEAVATAKAYVADAIATADQLSVGHGHGPTHHFTNLYQ
ncbi:hydroxymethylpyrimidine/phosphomethylpyrimidine kinase [Monaibacterium marinum]|uniref:hydroxymethylpyrimidine kinase n=1 Tax=Pontivivens marinum TaxID=1690039 RepID=A0A2C9CRB2_9RHOB|nr:bifunctional hydroxymethylpyrimidine kinase/phosphomethylpyrimidine kinase [Monaibacterium marinum]SOH93884.1 hydroxymethylpyrimidine/phosphomethylpyrimidine kinase [Monaibacterium marinum]